VSIVTHVWSLQKRKNTVIQPGREERTTHMVDWMGQNAREKNIRKSFLMGEIVLSYLIDFVILNTLKYSWLASLHKSPVDKHVPVLGVRV